MLLIRTTENPRKHSLQKAGISSKQLLTKIKDAPANWPFRKWKSEKKPISQELAATPPALSDTKGRGVRRRFIIPESDKASASEFRYSLSFAEA